jgi:hypothetical protein
LESRVPISEKRRRADNAGLIFLIITRTGRQHPNHKRPELLSARRDRPRHRRTAEQCD